MNRRRFLTLAGGAALVPVIPADVTPVADPVKWSRARIAIPAVQAENMRMLESFLAAERISAELECMYRACAAGLGIPFEQVQADADALRRGWHIDPVRP